MNAGLILYRRGYLTLKEIYDSVKAFGTAAKETKMQERIELSTGKINRVLRLLDLSMGSRIIEIWIERCAHALECFSNVSRYELEKKIMDQNDEFRKYLLPHEFLFLRANAECRSELLAKLPNPAMEFNPQKIQAYDKTFLMPKKVGNQIVQ